MKFIKTLLIALLALLALVIGILFSSRNNEPVAVDLLLLQLPPMSIALWILMSFTLGALVTALAYGLINQSQKRANKRLLKQVNQMQGQRAAAK